jgi:hypothetical protein
MASRLNLGTINPLGISDALAQNPGGSLYALDSLGNEYTVGSTGNFTLVGNTGNHCFLDLTIAPAAATPERSSIILVGLAGAIVLARAWLHRRRADGTSPEAS